MNTNTGALQAIAVMALRQHDCERYTERPDGTGICYMCTQLDRLHTPDLAERSIFDDKLQNFLTCEVVECACDRQQKDIGLGALFGIGWRWNAFAPRPWCCPFCSGAAKPHLDDAKPEEPA